MTYEEICNYIEEIPKYTKKNDQNHTKKLLQYLGNPQRRFEIIHVAGSNGKGSVCKAISHALTKQNHKTGLFTSPHLVCLEERFLMNDIQCTKEQFVDAFLTVQDAVKKMQEDDLSHPSFFEYLFAMSMVMFAKERVDVVVLETGLGGRLDATNSVEEPVMTIITSISLEHTEILGDTIEEIAAEKAGIIKEGVPVLFDGTDERVSKVIIDRARAVGAPYYKILPENMKILRNTGKKIDFLLRCGYDENVMISIPFAAEYQVMNMALAYRALDILSTEFTLEQDWTIEALKDVVWPGRMQEVADNVYLDGAHNVSGIEAFLKTVRDIGRTKPVLLFSMVKEKNYEKVIELLADYPWDRVVVTEIKDARGLSMETLVLEFEKNKKKVTGIKDSEEAYNDVMKKREDGQVVFCTGSLYLVGELENVIGGLHNDRF